MDTIANFDQDLSMTWKGLGPNQIPQGSERDQCTSGSWPGRIILVSDPAR